MSRFVITIVVSNNHSAKQLLKDLHEAVALPEVTDLSVVMDGKEVVTKLS